MNPTKVLIATIYTPDPVLLASNRLGPDKLILLMSRNPDKTQKEALKLIKNSLGRVIEIETATIDVYDIVNIATVCVRMIDDIPADNTIYVNITAGRKTQAMGLLFAAYARTERVKKIAYNPEEDHSAIVYLPKLSFHLTNSQKRILSIIQDQQSDNYTLSGLAEEAETSRAMLYRNLDELKDLDLITLDKKPKLTDAGRIAVL